MAGTGELSAGPTRPFVNHLLKDRTGREESAAMPSNAVSVVLLLW